MIGLSGPWWCWEPSQNTTAPIMTAGRMTAVGLWSRRKYASQVRAACARQYGHRAWIYNTWIPSSTHEPAANNPSSMARRRCSLSKITQTQIPLAHQASGRPKNSENLLNSTRPHALEFPQPGGWARIRESQRASPNPAAKTAASSMRVTRHRSGRFIRRRFTCARSERRGNGGCASNGSAAAEFRHFLSPAPLEKFTPTSLTTRENPSPSGAIRSGFLNEFASLSPCTSLLYLTLPSGVMVGVITKTRP